MTVRPCTSEATATDEMPRCDVAPRDRLSQVGKREAEGWAMKEIVDERERPKYCTHIQYFHVDACKGER